MDGLGQLTASAHTIAIGGRTYRLTPLTLADYGEIENRILAGRPDPLAGLPARLAGRTPPERQAALGRALDQAAAERRVGPADLDQWWQTAEGFCYRFWLMARKDQPQMTLEAAADLLRSLGAEQRVGLGRRMERCCGWPSPDAARQPQPAEEVIPWYRWAAELSRAFGWTPDEIGRLTIAQMCIYLGKACDSASRRHVPLAEGVALCRQRQADRQRWIQTMMEELEHVGSP